MNKVDVIRLGRTDYQSTWDVQHHLFDLRVSGKIPDLFLLNEHNHVYTMGKNTDEDHLLSGRNELRERNVDVYKVDRGGDVTYHGPGQLVGYPILDLSNYYLDLHRYLRDLEELIVRTLADFGIAAHRDRSFTGVWVGDEKIAAIGVRVSRWVTMHGFALNVNTDLSYFDRIIPCGIFHKGVTSIERLLGQTIPLDEISTTLIQHFAEVFGVSCMEGESDKYFQLLSDMKQIECVQ